MQFRWFSTEPYQIHATQSWRRIYRATKIRAFIQRQSTVGIAPKFLHNGQINGVNKAREPKAK